MEQDHRFLLGEEGLRQYRALQAVAAATVADRFYATFPSEYETFGDRGREACREDLSFHLEFLRPVIEFGYLRPFVDYLHWLHSVLRARGVPTDHLVISLEWLAEFFSAHLPAEHATPVTAALDASKHAIENSPEAPSESEKADQPSGTDPCADWPECSAFEQALLAGNQQQCLTIFREAFNRGHGFVEIGLQLIQPVLYRIGQRWQDNEISVAQEHLATAIAQSVLARGFALTQPTQPTGRNVTLACVEGNQHVVGLRLVADAFELDGWLVRFLGANTPVQSLVTLIKDERPHLVGLSISQPYQIHAAKETITRLRTALGNEHPPIMIGGYAINQFLPLVRVLGADVSSPDARSAIREADRLVSA